MIIINQHSDYFQWGGKDYKLEGDTVVSAMLVMFYVLNGKDKHHSKQINMAREKHTVVLLVHNFEPERVQAPRKSYYISLVHLPICSLRIIFYNFLFLKLEHLLSYPQLSVDDGVSYFTEKMK